MSGLMKSTDRSPPHGKRCLATCSAIAQHGDHRAAVEGELVGATLHGLEPIAAYGTSLGVIGTVGVMSLLFSIWSEDLATYHVVLSLGWFGLVLTAICTTNILLMLVRRLRRADLRSYISQLRPVAGDWESWPAAIQSTLLGFTFMSLSRALPAATRDEIGDDMLETFRLKYRAQQSSRLLWAAGEILILFHLVVMERARQRRNEWW